MNDKIRDENYLVITGWMSNKLKLKREELLVYALIYQFSQDNYSRYYGGRKYIAEWFNCSLSTIDRALDNLVEKNYIIKETYAVNNVTYNRYKCNLDILVGGVVNLNTPVVNLTTNNINNKEIKENNSNKLLLKEKQENKPKFTPPTLEEIEQYIKEKKYSVNPKIFYDYFNEGNWIDSEGKPVKNWKQKIITWEKKNKSKSNSTILNKPIPNWFNETIEDSDLTNTNDDFKQFLEDFRKNY